MSIFTPFLSWWAGRASTLPPQEDSRGDDPAELEIDAAGWIHGDGVIHMPSARGRAKYKTVGGLPSCVVRHATATAWGTGGAIAREWRRVVEPHSAHVTIDVVLEPSRTAEVKRWKALGWAKEAEQLAALPVGAAVIYQHRSFLEGAWHAYGALADATRTRTSGTIDGRHLNDISIGIEATCVGQVARKLDDRWRGWASGRGVGYGPAVTQEEVIVDERRSWHTYHPAVLAIETHLDALLLARFPSLAGEVTITPSPYAAAKVGAKPVTRPAMAVGHCDVDPTRKSDPYPTGARRGRPA